jgi:hypothetical protein
LAGHLVECEYDAEVDFLSLVQKHEPEEVAEEHLEIDAVAVGGDA